MTPHLCDTCLNYQKSRDPYGCFKQYATTDFHRRLEFQLFGCAGYRKEYADTGNHLCLETRRDALLL